MTAQRAIPTEFTAERLRATRERLENAVAALIAAESTLDRTKSESIYVFHEASLKTGLSRLEGFTQELLKSVYAAREGKPYTAETRKARGKK